MTWADLKRAVNQMDTAELEDHVRVCLTGTVGILEVNEIGRAGEPFAGVIEPGTPVLVVHDGNTSNEY
jgi:hypothetical protein